MGSSEIKETMALKIGIPVKNVQIWFQNRRAKDKNIKEHILSESRKRHEEYQIQSYQRQNMSFIPDEDNIPGFYSETNSHIHSDYNNMSHDYNHHGRGYQYDHHK